MSVRLGPRPWAVGLFPRPRSIHHAAPVERAPAPDVDVAGHEEREKRHHLPEADHPQLAERDRPRIEEGDFDVEEQEDHRDEIELDRLALAGIADGGHSALVRRGLLGRRLTRTDELREQDVTGGKPDAEADHDEDRQETVHASSRLLPGAGASPGACAPEDQATIT